MKTELVARHVPEPPLQIADLEALAEACTRYCLLG